ncbi:MAG: hemerythrin cation binding protein [Rickettsiaceae bacterium]|jgi:hemerythrin superfamily protein|nr:hemerythrin cation binding protein [Rickettsiaceae bacterium]
MDIYELLKYDHNKVKELLNKLEKKKDIELFKQLKTEVIAHSEAEEEAFYAPLKKKVGKLAIIVDAGHEEHNLAMKMMEEIENVASDEEWQSLLAVIKKSIEAHITMEEEDLFKLAEKNLSDKEAKEMATQMTKLKAEYKETA